MWLIWEKENEARLTFVKNYFVSKDDDIKFSIGNQPVEDISARFTSSLDV